ncbi:hypothetical protein ADL15_23835 [Actinoplanes awajinensis subsp. mycoplanecinus]|uniref:Shikimate kinase n=1 Tax=Actinoplanes awajinensis subsp. mycoplanecinus TaxID=135947 RepID=A0A101JQ88_9ACTN|nr:hypothetical protein ADL15_23835 [Actinoplanes awajinensis subsp. mycoplanecinus]
MWINGVSGSGKSALAAVLAGRGLPAIDADEDPALAGWVDEDGRPVAESQTDADWLRQHLWVWHPERLDELIGAPGSADAGTVYVCGNAANDAELWDRFARVVLLVVDEPTMLARLDDPARDNDFGRSPDERALCVEWLPSFQRERLALGAIPIDASQPLEQVADAVIRIATPGPGATSPHT